MARISDLWIQDHDMARDAANWDARAPTFDGPIMSKDDSLIKIILDRAEPNKSESRIIDIGCGTGRMALAFADTAKEVVGLDLSQVMIGMANEKAKTAGMDNAKFFSGDWSTMDPSDLGMFNITIANMTPAICSKETFEKMLSVSKGWVFVSCHISPGNRNWNDICELLGQHRSIESNKALFILDMLWEREIHPEISYIEGRHKRVMPADFAFNSFISAARESGILNDRMSLKIKNMVEKGTEEDQFIMDSKPSAIIIYWKMPN